MRGHGLVAIYSNEPLSKVAIPLHLAVAQVPSGPTAAGPNSCQVPEMSAFLSRDRDGVGEFGTTEADFVEMVVDMVERR